MENRLNMSLQKGKKRVKMRTRILIFILLVVVFQLLTCSAVLIFGGEFRDLREYSYQTLVEKTENSGTYLQRQLQEKSAMVREHARQLDGVVAGVLAQRGASIAEVQTDGELDDSVMEASVDILSGLLRYSGAHEAYLILDTGTLYAGDDGQVVKGALCLQQSDDEVGMVLGPAALAEEFGLTQHPDL